MRRIIIYLGLVLLLMSVIAGCGGGNSGGGTSPGSISGIISDVNGTGINNATVITIPATTTVTTQNDGSFSFTNVPPGNYIITTTANTYCTFSVAVNVTSGTNATKNVKLVSNTGLVAWYSLNGTANDLSGNAHHGTLHGPTSTTNHLGQANGAYLFNGTSDYISALSIINNPSELTFSVWVKHLSEQSQNSYVFYHKYGADFSIYFYDDPDPSVPFVSVKVDAFTGYGNSGDNILSNWVNLTGVFKSNDKLQIYQNGTSKPKRDLPGSSIYTGSSGGLTIGAMNNSDGFFHGAIADIRIFSRVLSDDEITALAQR